MKNSQKIFFKIFLVLIVISFISCVSTKHNLAKPRSSIKLSNISATVIIDAGHGGKDSGAVGLHGLKEKDLTLDIARRVKRLFRKVMPNLKVIFTRTEDKFVGLEDRVSIANKSKGDLFVSLHINSSEKPEAKGFEVYSLDVASDRHSERLAARENQSFSGEQRGVNFILADLRANSNRRDSDFLAKHIATSLNSQFSKKMSSLSDRGYNQAIFQVLFVEMPSVLTELFFISNPAEERMLSSSAGRELCARGIVLGVKKYLQERQMSADNAKP